MRHVWNKLHFTFVINFVDTQGNLALAQRPDSVSQTADHSLLAYHDLYGFGLSTIPAHVNLDENLQPERQQGVLLYTESAVEYPVVQRRDE